MNIARLQIVQSSSSQNNSQSNQLIKTLKQLMNKKKNLLKYKKS